MLDLTLKREGNRITTDIYRKPTHTVQYLFWSSQHPIQQNLGTVRTLMHRANTLIAEEEIWKIEKKVRTCGYQSGP